MVLPPSHGIIGSMVSAFKDSVKWLDETVAEIQSNLEYLRSELAEKVPGAKLFNMESTYLVWIDLSHYRLENPQKTLLLSF
ncbi:MAG: aminotransferase class I/II-fold pyridoxal phosphate-dependent enzyme [Opitutae bacterium]|nr:aminotransferase class I/II-fold pyridoxal phosphate-dependent enzyme [Opitutae bacterium]